MISPGPYRHSVWIDVFGALLVGAVLLGGAGYLLYHADVPASSPVAPGPVSGPYHPGERAAAAGGGPRGPRPSAGPALSSSRSRSGPLLSDRSAPAPAPTPFSDGWREQATPSLSGPSSEGGASFGGGASAGGAGSSGPAIASSPSLGDPGYGSSRSYQSESGGQNAGQAWQGEAQKLAGRARALSGQLRQLERKGSSQDGGKKTSSESSPGEASTASATTNDRDVPQTPSVPIDDHLHWLVVAGLLWGIWRLAQP